MKLIFKSPPVLFLGLDCVKVGQVNDIWPNGRHGSPTDTTIEGNKSTPLLSIVIERFSLILSVEK